MLEESCPESTLFLLLLFQYDQIVLRSFVQNKYFRLVQFFGEATTIHCKISFSLLICIRISNDELWHIK
jgi:hypothetical protein